MPTGRAKSLPVILVVTMTLLAAWAVGARAEPNFYTARCAGCHADDTTTCVGCHEHRGSLSAVTDKAVYAPGDTIRVTLRGGTRGGWLRALLINEGNVEVSRRSGPTGTGDDKLPNAVRFPVTLKAVAPSLPGSHTWQAAWYGNTGDGGSAHGENRIPVTFTVDDQDPTRPATWSGIKRLLP